MFAVTRTTTVVYVGIVLLAAFGAGVQAGHQAPTAAAATIDADAQTAEVLSDIRDGDAAPGPVEGTLASYIDTGAFEDVHVLPEPHRTQYQDGVRNAIAAGFEPLFTVAFILFNVGVRAGVGLKPVPSVFITGTMQAVALAGLGVYLLLLYRQLPTPEVMR